MLSIDWRSIWQKKSCVQISAINPLFSPVSLIYGTSNYVHRNQRLTFYMSQFRQYVWHLTIQLVHSDLITSVMSSNIRLTLSELVITT
uniref:Ovule protein n=1 Tax=Steinernema glaseri TaxID=37863 RepID=A0A1I8AEW4_9BILA